MLLQTTSTHCNIVHLKTRATWPLVGTLIWCRLCCTITCAVFLLCVCVACICAHTYTHRLLLQLLLRPSVGPVTKRHIGGILQALAATKLGESTAQRNMI